LSVLLKRAPLRSVLLIVLATVSSVTAAYVVVPQLSDFAQVMRDFSVTASPSSMSLNQGFSTTAVITVASLDGFDLATGLSAVVSPRGIGLTALLSLNVVTPSPGNAASSTLTVAAQPATPVGTYLVTVSSSGGTKSHSASVTVTVDSADFAVATSSFSLIVPQGGYVSATVAVTSLASFTGNVSISTSATLAYIGVTATPSSVVLAQGGSSITTLAISVSPLATTGIYTVTVTGASGLITHSLNIQVRVTSASCGTCGFESMSLDSYSFNSSTSLDLYLRNTGSNNISLASYYVKDASGDQYFRNSWAGPTILPNQVASTLFVIGSSCGSSCTLTGTAFTFVAGYSYTITVVTARNNQFTFTVVR